MTTLLSSSLSLDVTLLSGRNQIQMGVVVEDEVGCQLVEVGEEGEGVVSAAALDAERLVLAVDKQAAVCLYVRGAERDGRTSRL